MRYSFEVLIEPQKTGSTEKIEWLSQSLCGVSQKYSHGGRDGTYAWARQNGLPLTKTAPVTVVAKFPICQETETNSMSLIWHHPLGETNQPFGGKLTSLNSFHLERINNSSCHLDWNPQIFQLWICLSCLQGPRQHHFPRVYGEFDLLIGDPTKDHFETRGTL